MAMFLIALYAIFNSSFVQTKITQAIGNYLGNLWNTTVTLDRVYLEPFQRIAFEHLYIEDQHNDTLIYADRIFVNFNKLNIFKDVYSVEQLELNNANFFLRTYEGEDELNLAFIINTFNSGDELDTPTIDKEPFRLSIDDVEITNSRFIFQNQNTVDTSYGMHYADLDVSNINGLFSHVSIVNDSIHFHIESLNASEKSGIELHNLETKGHINGKGFDLVPLYISMNNSSIDANHLSFTYGEWGNFTDFIDKVTMDGDFQLATIKMEDISYFAEALQGWEQEFKLIGRVKGRVNNLSGNGLIIKTGYRTSFEGNFNIDGLPEIKTSFITVEAKNLHSELADIENIQIYPFIEGKKIDLPESVKEMGDFTFKGDFTGFINDFVAYGSLESNRGQLISDVSLKQLDNERLHLSGRLKAIKLDMGTLIGNPILNKLDCNLEASLYLHNGEFEKADMNGFIERIGFNKYDYTNIHLNGMFEPKLFTGYLAIDDPAINLDFKGLVDFSKDSINLNFDTDLIYADFGSLNILPIEKYSSSSGIIEINLKGKEWVNLLGEVDVKELTFCTDSSDFEFGELHFRNDALSNGKKLMLESEIISGEIRGAYDIATIHKDILWNLGYFIPSYFSFDSLYIPTQEFDFDFVFHDISFLKELSIFDMGIASESHIYGKINTIEHKSSLHFDSDSLNLLGINWESPSLHIASGRELLFVELISEDIQFEDGPEYFKGNELSIITKNDSLDLTFNWTQVDTTLGEINIETIFEGRNEFEISSSDSRFTFLDKNWEIGNGGLVHFDSTSFSFDSIEVATENQNLRINGIIGSTVEDTLNLSVNNFELSNFNYILQQFDYKIGGWSNGYFNWVRKEGVLKLEAELAIDSAEINDYYLGDIRLLSEKLSEDSSYHINVSLLDEKLEKLKIEGLLTPSSTSELMDLNVDFNDFDLGVLNYMNLPGISDVKGMTKGNINIIGTLQRPEIVGAININNGGLFVDVLGTGFTFSNRVDIYEDFIALDPFEIIDLEGRKAIGYGTILHDNLKDWNYDFSLEVDNFLVMDLKNKADALFYGKAYGTGDANIWGYNKLLFIDVAASTNENTQIFIPIKESNSVDRKEFIEFITLDSLAMAIQNEVPQIDISGVEMTLDIKVTPEAEVQLVFDEVSGDILKVESAGNLALKIDEKNGFTMTGGLETYSGEYVFTFESIISKKFVIPSGSKISWLGDPYNANIDISALYRTRASLGPLMVGFENEYKSRVNTFVYLYLKGNLQSPNIAFDIELPESEERERTALKSAISTTEDLNKQVVSLLLFNSFQSVSGWDEGGNFATTNTFELLSNQVSSWLSQISDEVDVNVHYRPGTENSGQEIDVGLTTDILDERVTITTQVGFKDPTLNPDANANSIVGDFIVEYKLTEDGRVRLKAFNKSNDNQYNYINQAAYKQGFGIIIRKDFDNKMNRKNPTDKEDIQKRYDKRNKKELEKKE